jgi:integrase
MKSLSKDELQRLLEVADSCDRLMILLAFNHGLRVSEVINLTAENFVDGHLVIQRLKGSKRTIQKLLANEAALLASHKPAADGRLFTMDRTTAWRHMRKLAAQVGIPAHRAHPHCLKHACAAVGLAGGMTLPEVQARLGHRSGSSTMVYLAVTEDAAS